MPLSDIVNVKITSQTQSVSQQGFGTPMILGTFKNWVDLIRQYSNMQGVAADFSPYQLEYIAAQDIFSQNIAPSSIYIGRPTVDTVTVDVETALSGQTYTTTINDIPISINSTTTVNQSVVTLSGIITWVLTFSGDFTSSLTGFTIEVNGQTTGSVIWNMDQATTLSDIADAIDDLGFTTTTPGSDLLTIVFNAPSTSSVIGNVIITGTSQPTVSSLIQSGPLVTSNSIAYHVNGGSTQTQAFTSNSLNTLNLIAANIVSILNPSGGYSIATAIVSGPNNNILTINSNPNQDEVINSFVVTAGASQATAAIVNTIQPTSKNSIVNSMVTAINAYNTPAFVQTATDNHDESYNVTANVSGVPFTLSVGTTILQPNAARVTITQALPNQAYTVRINGTSYTYQAPVNVTGAEQISLGLVSLINTLYPAITGSKLQPVTATDNSNGSFEIVADVIANPFLIQISPLSAMTVQWGLIIAPLTASASVTADLTAIYAVNSDWYALACTDRDPATVLDIAAWVEPQMLLFGTASSDANIINLAPGETSSIAAKLNNLGYVRTFCLYNQNASNDFPECAWMGNCLPLTPGSETWKFKTLNTIPYSDLSTNQENNAFGKSCNTYEYVGGVGITQNGTVASGEYIDIVRGIDWLTSTIQSYVYSVLVNNPKVPYTNKGITAVEGQIMRALELGIQNNFIAQEPPYQVFVPNALTVPAIDKTNRILNNVSFQATLAGAIQAINITGTLSV